MIPGGLAAKEAKELLGARRLYGRDTGMRRLKSFRISQFGGGHRNARNARNARISGTNRQSRLALILVAVAAAHFIRD
jgi:hypothetical protein